MKTILALFLVFMSAIGRASESSISDNSPYWMASLEWLQNESQKANIGMRGVILPTDVSAVEDFLSMKRSEMLAATFHKEFQINGNKYPTCVIGKFSKAEWGDWLNVMGAGKEDWVKFWFMAHEWGHCLDMMEGGLTAGATEEERLRGERRADAFATIVMIYATKNTLFVNRLYEQRLRNKTGSSHDTSGVLKYFLIFKQESIGTLMSDWWKNAKTITEEVY